MSEHSLPLARRWNSWNDRHPLELSYPPLGLAIRPALYAASRNAFSDIPITQPGLRLGPRSIDGDSIAASLDHAGTGLDWRWTKPDPFTVRGQWQTTRSGEWGLRFWVLLVCTMERPDGTLAGWHWDAASSALTTRHGAEHAALVGERPPLLVTFHATPDDLAAELDERGYFDLGSRGTEGPVAVLRYNLEEMPHFAFAGSIAHAPEAALAAARNGTAGPALPPPTLQTGRHAGALDAVRDVVGWNTVFDRVNRRPYTALSRFWVAEKFGGFGVWLDDILYHALMAASLDADVARENLASVLAHATAAGNLPCLVTGRDAWIDRSQPPIGAFVLASIAERLGDAGLVREAYPILLRNHLWWRAHRDGNGDGLYEYGTSPIGDALYRGTKLGAKNESSMDNSPVHDEAVLDPAAGTLDQADVGLNSLIALDAECLALLAGKLGRDAEAAELAGFAAALRQRIGERLWDADRRIFANRRWNGAFVRALAPTSFFPLLAGAASPSQIEAMLEHLDDPALFGGDWRLPSVARNDPAFGDNVYWRGRVWPPLNFLTWHALMRAGATTEARALAADSVRLFMAGWRERRLCPENFNAVSGAADDQPDTDLFYGWGGLMPLLGTADIVDVTPWDGLGVTHDGTDFTLGPLLALGGRLTVASRAGKLEIVREGRVVLQSTIEGRISRLRVSEHGVSCCLEASSVGSITYPQLAADNVVASAPLPVSRGADGAAVQTITAADLKTPLRLYLLVGSREIEAGGNA